ncbi:MAG: hypothetical protein ACI4P5_00600, partial [Candidatus Fimadaptatus sp.]
MTGFDLMDLVRTTRARIGALRDALRRLDDMSTSLVPRYGDGLPSGAPHGDALASLCARRDELQRRLVSLENVYAAQLLMASDLLLRISDTRREVCYRFYLRGDTVASIASALDRDITTIKRLKREGAGELRAIP